MFFLISLLQARKLRHREISLLEISQLRNSRAGFEIYVQISKYGWSSGQQHQGTH
jgi:Fe-S cluster biosynthesis and repair protein YggX